MSENTLEGFRLAPQQKRVWLQQSGTAPFVCQCILQVEGELDSCVIEKAVERMIARHESLRTFFPSLPGMELPIQAITDPSRVGLEQVAPEDLPTGIDLDDALLELGRRALRDFSHGPLVHFVLCVAAPGEARLALTTSSLCADEWSLRNLVDELANACEGADDGTEEDVGAEEDVDAEEPVQYVQFSEWQNDLLESAEGEEGQQHWRERGLLVLADLELPVEASSVEASSVAEARRAPVGVCQIQMAADLVDRLEALTRINGVSVRACLLTVWQTLLGSLGDRPESAVAVLCGGRPYEEMHGAVGLYARWPLVSSGVRHRSFLAAVEETERRVLEAEEWQEYFSWEELDGSGEAQPIPFGFSWNVWSEPAAGSRVRFRLRRRFVVSERLKAELAALCLGEQLELALSYDPELFSGMEARRLAARFQALLRSAVERPESPPRDLDLLGRAERAALLREWNDTAVPGADGVTLVDLFAAQVDRAPEAIAVVLEEQALSFGELDRRSRRLAHRLRSLGVGTESKVLLCTDRSLELAVGALGILQAGGAFVPIDPWQPEERLRLMIGDLQASVGVVEERWRGFLEPHLRTLVVVDGENPEDPPETSSPSAPHRASAPRHAAYVIFTSGSTGRPKGVVIEHRSVVHLTSALNRAIYDDLGSVGRVSINAPLSFDASIKQLIQLFLGRTVCLIPEEIRPDGEAMLAYLHRLRVEVLDCTPVQLSLLLAAGLAAGRGIPRAVLVGGEAIGPQLWTALAGDVERTYYNVYGPSECTVDATSLRIARATPRPSLGRPLSNVGVYLLDWKGLPVPVGLEGELHIGGAGLARGYLASPRLTAARFVPDAFSEIAGERLYKTGDRARHLRDGRLEFLGRVDLQVKVRGIRVELGEIEAALNEYPGLREAVVTLRVGDLEEPRLVAYAIPRAGVDGEEPAVDEEALRAYLRTRLPDYMVPRAFVLLDQLPLNRSGKIDRLALPSPEEVRPASTGDLEPLATPFEETVAAIWRDVLGAERIGRRSNFFELGGHSLLATQLMARIRSILKVDLALRTLFDGPTVAELATRVETALAGAGSATEPPLEPVLGDRSIPLSFGQERLWFLHQLEPLSSAYNAFKAVILDGPLDIAAMRTALDEVVRRHEVLRTHFEADDSGPRQVIELATGLALPVIDLSHLPVEVRHEAVERRAQREARRPFDLSRGPLLRCALLRLEAEEHIFHLALHHIVGDAWSMEILVRELTAIYGVASRRQPSLLPELSIQYGDFAVWQRRRLEGELLEAQLIYWQCQLEGQPPLLELPTDRPRSPVQTDRGDHCIVALSPRLSADLEELARRESVTSFMLLMAAWQTLLGRLCGHSDVSVGTPIAGRSRVEIEPLIGFFVNTLVMRLDLSGSPSFRQLLDRAREMTLGAFAHQDLPFERLVEALQPQRNTSYTPLFQAMFVFHNANVGAAEVELPGIRVRTIRPVAHAAMFDVTLTLVDSPTGLRGALEYNVDLFDRTTSLRWPRHLVSLLEGLVADPGVALSELPIFDAAERSQILVEWNDTRTVASKRLVHELFARQAALTPSAVALETPERAWTYAELDDESNRLARHLRELGVAPEVLVGVCFQRGFDAVVSFFAILKAGGAYLPLDPTYPRTRLRFLIDDAGVAFVLAERRFAALLPVPRTELLLGDDVLNAAAAQSSEPLESAARGDNIAYVIYTSGSTGGPKGVEVRHRSLAGFALGAIGRYKFSRGDRVLQFASLSFDTSCEEIFPTLASGATLVVGDGSVPSVAELLDLAESRSLTILDLPTAYWHQLSTELAEGRRSLAPSVRLVILGGERVLAEPLRRWRRAVGSRIRLWNSYGPTETTVTATGGPLAAELTIGRPDAGVRAHVVNNALWPVPIGVAGELAIGGEGVARGYRHRPALTAARFVPDPWDVSAGARQYRTGDRVRYLPEGRLDFRGRLDAQLKIRGFRVEPGEIENELRRHPGVAEAAVVAYEESPGNLRLVAHVVPSTIAEVELWRRFLGERLPDWSVPSGFSIHAELPRLTSGKIDRAALARWRPSSKPPQERRNPTEKTPVEELLADLWNQLLSVEVDDREQDFFTLGGHSLLAIQMVARIRHVYGVELPLRDIFEYRTLAALGARIERARIGGGHALPPIRSAPRDFPLPLSFGQERLWFLQQLEPASAAYNIPASLSIEGGLDIPALVAALGELIRRHEVLRTVYPAVEGRPIQAISPPCPVALPVIDLARFDASAGAFLCRRLVVAEALRPFDLEHGPVLRATLLRLGEAEHQLLLTMHHIASDGWSAGILTSELSALYTSARRGVASRLGKLPVQYADFAVWQRSWLKGAVLESELAYWRRRLRGLPPLLELPSDRSRPKLASYRGGSRRLRLSAALTDRLRELGRAEGATLFMVLLGGFAVLLSRLSGQRDFAVGVPVAGRTHVELEGLIGFFINSLVLRVELGGSFGFQPLLAKVRETTLEAHQHQAVPFERLVEELSPERSLSSSPLFQVMLIFQNLPRAESGEQAAMMIRPGEEVGGTEKFDLSLTVTEGGGSGLLASLSYATDLFDATTVERWLGYLGVLLDGLAREPVRPVESFTLLSAGQRHQLLTELGEVASRPLGTACAQHLVARQSAAVPDAIAVTCGDRHLSYGELERYSEQMAERLLEIGLAPEERVGIYLERDLELVVAILGIFKAGGAYVPLDPAYPARRTAFMLEDAGVSVLIARDGEALDDRLAAPRRVTPEECRGGSIDRVERRVRPAGEPGRLAYVLYTSGSTGMPKGVAIEHRSVSALLRWAHSIYGAEELSRVLAATSISFDLSVFEILAPLSAGGRVELVENVLALPSVAGRGIRLLNTVPSAMAELARLGSLPPSLETVNLAGEPLGHPLAKTLYELGVERVYNLYGPSEDTTYSTWWRASRSRETPSVPIGRPLEHTRCFVLGQSLEEVPLGVHGELCLAGWGLARGYLGRPGLTAERFVPDPFAQAGGERLYRTGDLVRRLGSGELLFLGRIDHQVKVRGFRIELGEIESALESYEGVQAAAVAVDASDGGSLLVAWIVLMESLGVSFEDLRRSLRRQLPEFMVPSRFVTLEQLPRTPGGKVDRKALVLRSPRSEPDSHAPSILRAPVEELLAGLWQEVLGVESVGAGNDFFALGGHSLLATRLVARIRHLFGVEVPIREVFEHRTLGALAAWIEAARRSGAPTLPTIDRAARDLPLPLSFGQERLWFLQQLDPESSAYNIPAALSLEGTIDVASLAAAFGELVRRHEVLRTSYPVIEGRPAQAIAPAGPAVLTVVDLSGVEPEQRSTLCRRLAAAEASRPFNLESGPVLRAVVFRLSEVEHRLLVTIHHIASDGWSAGIVMQELSALYEALKWRRGSPLPELGIQYADFAVWQRRWLAGETLADEIGYWKTRLTGAPTLLELPTDRPRPTRQRYRGRTVPVVLGREASAELSAFGRQRGSTPFMIILSVFQALLGRQAGENDVVVGAPVAGRSHVETEGLIGFFVNMLMLRTDVGGEPTFDQLVTRAREVVLDAYAHLAVPFEKLVEELAPERSLSHSPLFQVMLALRSFEGRETAGGTTVVDSEPEEDLGTAKYDLTLALTDSGSELSGALEYDVDLFDKSTARRFARGFEVMLSAALSRPDHPIWDLPLLSSSERQQILREWPEPIGGKRRTTVFSRLGRETMELLEAAEKGSGGFSFYLLDQRRRPVPLGAVGELWVELNDLELDTPRPVMEAEQFSQSPGGDRLDSILVHTDRRARFFADGRLELLDRLDFRVGSRRLGAGSAKNDPVFRTRVAPRDGLERALVEIWRDLLDRDEIGVTESFFDLGGYSLLAFRMVAQIEQRLARKVPLAVIFRGPTIEALAGWLHNSDQRPGSAPPWVEIQPRGSRPPMFWVHPVGGTVSCYLALSLRLGPEQPFLAFQALGIEAGEMPLRTVEALAERYCGALIASGIKSPFTLGGWSLGGVVAYEMACRLERVGRPAEHVILVDSQLPNRPDRGASGAPNQAKLFLGFARGLGITREALTDLLSTEEFVIPIDGDDEAALAQSLEIARAAGVVPEDLGLDALRRLLKVYTAHTEALDAYTAQPYCGSVSLLQATHKPDASVETAKAWRELVGDGLEIHQLEGDHYSLLAEPDVRNLAARILALHNVESAEEGLATSKPQRTNPSSSTIETDRSSVQETTGG